MTKWNKLKNGDVIFITLSTGDFFEGYFRGKTTRLNEQEVLEPCILFSHYDNRVNSNWYPDSKMFSIIPYRHIAMISRITDELDEEQL